MSCEWLCWAALALLIGVVMIGLGILLYPRGARGRDLSRELTRELDEWHHPGEHRRSPPATVGGPNP